MVGKSLSHYKILSELGRGGMGIVYKAKDTKLDRTVAIKVLPSAALASEDDRARFYREAKAAAQLHHPHIASVFEIDEAVPEGSKDDDLRPFIAMEYIEGKTLDARIKEGPLKLEDAVRIASEIASALEAAHKKEIVHRDIKSQNVMLTEEDAAKVLDFGLAKTAQSTKLTRMASTLGTVSYMSPEQARGDEVDLRTDLWSLGVVLYEMIAGKSPFPGDYEQAVVYEILNQDPEPLTALRTGVPMQFEWLVNKLLAKAANERYQSATDLLVDLKKVDVSGSRASGSSSVPLTSQPDTVIPADRSAENVPTLLNSASRAWPIIIATALISLALGYGLFAVSLSTPISKQVRRTEILLPGMKYVRYPSISPTQEWMAFIGEDTLGQKGIFLYEVETGEMQYVEGTESADYPSSFSPDGSTLAFTFGLLGPIITSTVPGGVPILRTDIGSNPKWENNSTLIYSNLIESQIFRLALDENQPEQLVLKGPQVPEGYADWVYAGSALPGTRVVLGSRERFSLTNQDPTLIFVDLDTGELKLSESGIINARFVPGNYLIYQRGSDNGPLIARPFNPDKRSFLGPPKELISKMNFHAYSVGVNGSIVYVPAAISGAGETADLVILDVENRSHSNIDLPIPNGSTVDNLDFSETNNQIALRVELPTDPNGYLAVYDLSTDVLTRKTFEGYRADPVWSADAQYLYYSDSTNVYRRLADGSGGEELVYQQASAPLPSADGKWLALEDVSGIQ